MNLIEQQNVLKGLTDESLTKEMQQPSGQTPPYLVMAELGRRKTARERYDGEMARKAKPTTVIEDMMAVQPMPSGDTGQSMVMPQGNQPMAAPAAETGIAAFADGGLVDAGGGLDYAAIGKRYSDTLGGLGGQRDRARALALISAGAGIMGGKSSNFLKNLGGGIAPAVQQYGQALETIDNTERNTLRDALDLQRAQRGEDLQYMQFDWQKERAGQEDALSRERMNQDRKPANVVEFEYRKTLSPDDQAEYDRLHPAYNPNTQANEIRIADKIDDIYVNALKQYPVDAMMQTPEEVAANQTKAQMEAYNRIKAVYGADRAEQWAAGIGLSDGDIAAGATGGTAVNQKDPLGLGL